MRSRFQISMDFLSKPIHEAEFMCAEHQLPNLEFSELTSTWKTILIKAKNIKMCCCEAYMFIINIYPSNHLKLGTKDLLKVYVSLTLLRIESAGDNKIQTHFQLFLFLKFL